VGKARSHSSDRLHLLGLRKLSLALLQGLLRFPSFHSKSEGFEKRGRAELVEGEVVVGTGADAGETKIVIGCLGESDNGTLKLRRLQLLKLLPEFHRPLYQQKFGAIQLVLGFKSVLKARESDQRPRFAHSQMEK